MHGLRSSSAIASHPRACNLSRPFQGGDDGEFSLQGALQFALSLQPPVRLQWRPTAAQCLFARAPTEPDRFVAENDSGIGDRPLSMSEFEPVTSAAADRR